MITKIEYLEFAFGTEHFKKRIDRFKHFVVATHCIHSVFFCLFFFNSDSSQQQQWPSHRNKTVKFCWNWRMGSLKKTRARQGGILTQASNTKTLQLSDSWVIKNQPLNANKKKWSLTLWSFIIKVWHSWTPECLTTILSLHSVCTSFFMPLVPS